MLLRRLRVDVIHAVEESAFMAAGFRYFFGIPYIYDMDSSLAQQLTDRFPILHALKPLLNSLERVAIRGSAGVIAVCRSLEDIARRGDGRKRVLRLEDISLLAENPEPAENIRELLALKGLIVMYIGNLEHYQGIDLLLESVQLAAAEFTAVELVVVGGSADHIDHYRRKAGDLGIGKRTHFLGPRPIEHLNSLLSQADILVSPRISGGNTPMKIYSYLASGKPLLATRLYTHTQVLNDDVAELVEPEPAAMSRGMIRLLQSSDYAEALGRRGQEMANTEYSYPQYEAKLVQFYDAVQETLHKASAEKHGLKLPMKKAR
jgi:glycosyltransferase involved in cell wall biosynthesis